MAQSGHGAALAFTTLSTFAPEYTNIGGPGWSRPSLDTTHLTTAGGRTTTPGDVWTIEPQTHTYLMDPDTLATTEADSIQDLLFSGSDAAGSDTITITLANAGASTFAAAAHVTGLQIQDITTDELLSVELTTQFELSPTITE